MLDLHAALSSVMDGGYSYLVKHGRISRIDIAIDLPKLHMDQFLLLPHQQLTTTQWSSKGQLQSLQYGKAQSSHTMIYDRWAKRKGKGQPTAGKEGVRIERRLKDPKLKLADLYTLPFPFKEIAIEQMSANPPEGEKKPYLWSYFQCAVQKKGLTAALGELPVSKRTQYRKYMEQHKVEWWNPAAIWAGWKPMLDKLKIADPHGFT